MNLEIENFVAKQKLNLAMHSKKFDSCWAMDLVSKKPVIFEVLNVDFHCGEQRSSMLPAIKPSMFVKISVNWMSADYMNESFWVEVNNVNVDASDGVHLFGTCANNTERVAYGSVIGPIYLRNILKVEE